MSGHSKWAQIKRQKGLTDGKRANVFTKLAKTISIAVKESGGITDPGGNFKLRLAIEKAKQANMPKSNIERAIDSGTGKGGGVALEAGLYEGYAPGNVMIMVETLSDNSQRTFSELKNLFERSGGRLVQPGAISYMFDHVGVIKIIKVSNPDAVLLEVMDLSGVVDVVSDESGEIMVFTDVKNLKLVQEAVVEKSWEIEEMYLGYRPKNREEIEEIQLVKLSDFIDKLHDCDDVERVFTVVD